MSGIRSFGIHYYLVLLIFGAPIVANAAPEDVCKNLEGVSICFPGVIQPVGNECKSICSYCRGITSYKIPVTQCVRYDVKCTESGCVQGQCLDYDCNVEDKECSNDITRLGVDPGTCKCPPAPGGYVECQGSACGNDRTCNN